MSLRSFLARDFSFRRRLPAAFGHAPIVVSPGASLSLLKPSLHSDLFAFAEEFVHIDDSVWDIGANVGLLTFAAAHRAGPDGHVLAVEADLFLTELLRRSAALQPATSAPVQIVPAAASLANGIADFHIAKDARATNHLAASSGSSQTGGIRETVPVVTLTLDWLLDHAPAPTVLKIDVEGAEADVLRGAERILSVARPVLLCEVYAANVAYVTQTLNAHNYDLFDWESSARPRTPTLLATYNTLAIPR